MNIAQYIIDIAAKGDAKTLSKVNSLQSSLDKADRSAGRLKKSLGQAFSSLPGAEFFTNPIVALTAGIGVVSKLGMETEKTAASFNVLFGSEDKAAKALGEIYDYADRTLWDRSTALSVIQTMRGFSVSSEHVVDDMKMLADVAVGDKNRLQQLAVAFGQISSYGHLAGQELRQLINAGFNPLQELAEMTGKSMEQLTDEMAKGLISFDMVRAAFIKATSAGGRFYNITEAMANTSFGAARRLAGQLVRSLLEIYNIIQPLIIPVLNSLNNALQAVGNMAQWVVKNMEWIAPVLASLAAGFGAYVVVTKAATIASGAFAAILKVVNFVMSMNPVGRIVAVISALIAAIVVCWNKFAGFRAVILTVWDTMKGFGEVLKTYVLDRITGIVSGIGNLGLAISKLFKGDFAGAWETAKAGANQFLGIDAARNAASSARNLAGGVRDNFDSHLESERAKQAAKDAIKEPKAAAGAAGALPTIPGATPAPTATTTANDITTGGTRNTSIVLNIGKFFDDVVIHNTNNTSLGELRDAVLESVNRSLEIAISAAR